MLRTSIQSLLAYRGRLVATVLAITLGVGFVAGTLLFGDAFEASFIDTIARQERGVDLAVQHVDDRTMGLSGEADDGTPAGLVDRVRAVPGVAAAEGRLSGSVRLLDGDGNPVGPSDGSAAAISVAETSALRWVEVTDGRVPLAADEIALDQAAIQVGGLRLGQRLQLVGGGQSATVRLVGVLDLSASLQAVNITMVAMPRPALERLVEGDRYDRVDVVAAEGTDHDALAARLNAAVGDDYRVTTRRALIDLAARSLSDDLLVFRNGLRAFAAVSLFVAAVVIQNTFTILVAQRARQLALLRCLGASRGQVFRATLTESALLGAVASLLGVGAGLGMVHLLGAVVGQIGLTATNLRPVLTPTIVGVSAAAGMAVTVAAALLPAARATRVAPLAAMRGQALAAAIRPSRRRTLGGALLLLAGVAALAAVTAGGGMAVLLAGGMLTFLGVTALSPHLVGPLTHALGTGFGLTRRTTGRLATANTRRNPRRTAATTAALTIGVTLITAFTVGTTSMRASAVERIRQQFPVEYALTAQGGQPVPDSVVAALDAAPEIAWALPTRSRAVRVAGAEAQLLGVDAATLAEHLDLGVTAGSFGGLASGGGDAPGIAVSLAAAERGGLEVGDTVPVTGGPDQGTQVAVRVAAVFPKAKFGNYLVTMPLLDRLGTAGGSSGAAAGGPPTVMVKAAEGTGAVDSRAAVLAAIQGHPEIQLADSAGLVDQLTEAVEQLLAVVTGLLALAIVIALLGIANTLGLSVIERVRESALLRALGLTRGQLRAMLAVEAVLTSLIGTLVGLALGLVFARVGVTVMADQANLGVFVIPWVQLAAGAAAAIVIGLLASVLPGRAAALTDVVSALAAE